MSSELERCQDIIIALSDVFHRIEDYIVHEHVWDLAIMNKMHLERQSLTVELYKSLPSPLSEDLKVSLVDLHKKTHKLLDRLSVSQHETRDAIFQLQNVRKANNAYGKIARDL